MRRWLFITGLLVASLWGQESMAPSNDEPASSPPQTAAPAEQPPPPPPSPPYWKTIDFSEPKNIFKTSLFASSVVLAAIAYRRMKRPWDNE